MHPSALLIMVAAIAAPACATTAVTTPAARFWEENLPGTPMPPTIAELVQKGTDHSPLKQPSSSPQVYQPDACLGYSYRITCSPSAAVAATGVFFRQENVALGSVMTVHFPPVDLPAILPRADAEKAPFANVSDVLATFSIASGSSRESNVRTTISACQAPPLAGERQTCATSLEGAVRAAARMLGTSAARLSVAASALTPREGLPRQEYEVVAVAPLGGGRHVTCHDDPFPYAVYRCHMEKEASTGAYVLTLRCLQYGSGAPVVVDMVAVCHLDTSNWSSAHPAFETLNLRPGGAPVCHFMPYADLLFTEKAANA
ncbi:BURP domain-containing protein 6-like [Miscanthus floridulus]|uniref:BURP domain-containing protein 6-like n=1 Tax=Miscanthus floridulus TaxID=154761 RepID=UPI00345A688B